MKGLFDYDSGFFRALDKLGSLFILNLITLVCSIPFVTVGAAFTALYYVTMKMVKDEETYILKDYFRSFRQNFVQATVIWLIFFVVGSIMYFDYRIASTYRESFPAAGRICPRTSSQSIRSLRAATGTRGTSSGATACPRPAGRS